MRRRARGLATTHRSVVEDYHVNTSADQVICGRETDTPQPKRPPHSRLAAASTFASDAKASAWLLHRPRTLKPGDAAMAAPPVVVFDTAGAFVKAWGSEDAGLQWPQREHGIHVD